MLGMQMPLRDATRAGIWRRLTVLTLGDISTSRDTEALEAAPHRPPVRRERGRGAGAEWRAGGRDSRHRRASARVRGESLSQTALPIPQRQILPPGRRV